MLSTTEYDAFKFREDNRNGVNRGHVEFLIKSIKANNRLRDQPIKVTRDLQVINGQHRLLAAKELGVEVFYEYVDAPDAQQMAIENMNKQWSPLDYLNLYVKNGYKEYIRLAEFMREMRIPIKFALAILRQDHKSAMHNFKMGEFVFQDYAHTDCIPLIWQTVEILQAHAMKGNYLRTVRFWQALIILFSNEKFNPEKWFKQVRSHAHRFVVKARTQDYLAVIEHVYNFHSSPANCIRLTNNMRIDP